MKYKNYTTFKSFLFAFGYMLYAFSSFATIHYVMPQPSGSGDGSSWANASKNIAAMISVSNSGDQIWIAKGTYTLAATLSMKNGVAIYGGFAGTESLLSQRNLTTNQVVISGNNSIQVFNNSNLDKTAILDGCTISNGFSKQNDGGGMYNYSSNPSISNCVFSENRADNGGGMYNKSSSPNINHCIFSNNRVSIYGGGMFNESNIHNSTIQNCVFTGNIAVDSVTNIERYGGGIYNLRSNLYFVNCLFTGNSANDGGAIFNYYTQIYLVNCVLTGNIVMQPNKNGYPFGGAILNDHKAVSNIGLTNTIIYNNKTSYGAIDNVTDGGYASYVNNCDIQGFPTGLTLSDPSANNLSLDPQFANPSNPLGPDGFWMTTDDGLQVVASSPCHSAGTINDPYYGGLLGDTTDILGATRSATAPTIGAYENTICVSNKLYVNQNVVMGGSGGSWATALKTIGEALQLSMRCTNVDTIWVAAGTYTPNATLSMKNGVAILGGFSGTETSLSQRNYLATPTIISGGNVRRVFSNSNLNNTAVLDGFTISHGSATIGGGMFNDSSNLVIRNCTFLSNWANSGGGMHNDSCNPIISNCVFADNTAYYYNGGGIENNKSSPSISNCVFVGNSAGVNGGGIQNANYSNPTLTNCIFKTNTSSIDGGGMYNSYSNPIIINAVFTGNSGDYGCGGIYNFNSGPKITNTIICRNISNGLTNIINYLSTPIITYSLIEGGYAGTGNINGYPSFVNEAAPAGPDGVWMTADDGLRLMYGSAGINAGIGGAGIPTTDILGVTRSTTNPTMGTYEKPQYGYHKIYVNKNVSSSGYGGSWASAKKTIDEALQLTAMNYNIDTIWIAAGTYTPAATLSMVNGLALIGGFAGNETLLNQRNFAVNPTIISGENTKIVFSNYGLNNTAVLDGCTISRGYATVDGGGMLNNNASPTVRNCVFSGNEAKYAGGGMNNFNNSSPIISNCVFTVNKSSYLYGGGGMSNTNSNPVITNSVFFANSAVLNGGGIFNLSSNPSIINCSIKGNVSASGGGIYNNGSSPIITNTIVYGNTESTGLDIFDNNSTPKVTNSCIQGNSYYNNTNITTDPLFINQNNPAGADGFWMTADDGLALQPCSPAVNAGITTSPALPTDLIGNARVGVYDIGTYEYQGNISGLAPVAGSLTSTSTKNQSGITDYSQCTGSHLIATIGSVGTPAIVGSTTAIVWIEPNQPTEFVKRHYQITPAANASSVTGRITIYFTQKEFDDFNNQSPAPALLLPTGPTDATGIANLRIEKRSGISSDGTGLPNTYPGTPVNISPTVIHIYWNASAGRWEVTFDVTGFSGFFVKTQSAFLLPIHWVNVSGKINSNSLATFNWQVQEINVLNYEVEKSNDGINFSSIGNVSSKGWGINKYEFTDPAILSDIAYYRIKETDVDGKFSYSSIIKLNPNKASHTFIYPNPTKDLVTVSGARLGSNLMLADMNGKILQQIIVTQNSFTLDLSNYAKGVYVIKTEDGVQKIIKE